MTEVDLSRFTDLSRALGQDLPDIVEQLSDAIQEGIEASGTAFDAGDLEEAARAAHGCRNDALVLGATELLAALAALEAAARSGRPEDTRIALRAVHDLWPRTRAALERAVMKAL